MEKHCKVIFLENINNKNGSLFITSDEEPKDGDWCYHPELSQEYTIINNGIQTKGLHPAKGVFQWRDTTNEWYKKARKIIATTDTSLKTHKFDKGVFKDLEYSLPKPSTQFIEQWIEEYNKDNIITDVKVEYEEFMTDVIIGKTKIELKVNPDNTINIKLPQPTLYTEEEVVSLLNKLGYDLAGNGMVLDHNLKVRKYWLNENLKK